MRIGEVMYNWRVVEKEPLRRAAEKIGISVATLSRIECGSAMDALTMYKLIKFLFEDDSVG